MIYTDAEIIEYLLEQARHLDACGPQYATWAAMHRAAADRIRELTRPH